MNRRDFLKTAGAFAAAPSAPRPNVVVIVSDDHGYADLSCYQHPSEIRTPNIDRLARRGVRFEQGYANAYVCAPTRAALMTGRYPQRYGFYTASDSRVGLPRTQATMADVMRRHGYATGAFGKWHLGIEPDYHPVRRGFDEFYGFLGHGGHDYFDLKAKPDAPWGSIWRNDKIIDDTGYLTDNLGREATAFIGRHEKHPFFLYLAFNAVHFPLQAPPELIRKYDTGNPSRNTYLAMLEREDAAVGRVLDELERRGLDRNTLIVFFSDNGGARNNASNNGILRDYKHSVYEGGIRVPFMVSWPGRLKPDSTSREPVMSMDVLPTVCAATGATVPGGIEGRNILSPGPLHEAMFWDGYEDKTAVRAGRWKLVNNQGKVELFDLEADPSEKTDLAARQPETVARLRQTFEEWKKGNAPRIGKGPANDEGGGGGTRKKKKKK